MGLRDRFRRRSPGSEPALHGEPDELSQGSPEDSPDLATEVSDDAPAGRTRKGGWTGARLVGLLAGVAVVSLLIGVGAMQFIVSPAELAARTAPPDAGPVTAAVEMRTIENTVLARGEVTYADAVKLSIDSGSAENRPVVTGHVPEVGAVLNTGNIALELAGRPVIVLAGELPAYRDLSIGMRGPDVTQLKHALSGLGYGAGDLASDTFDWDTAVAVGALYEQLGYPAPSVAGADSSGLRDAERAVRAAQVELTGAQAALDDAAAAKAQNRAALIASRDAASENLADANRVLAQAQQDALPKLPSSEVTFLAGLPRRVDEVTVKRGAILEGSPMVVSGATLAIVGTISQQDASLLADGAVATYSGPDGVERSATLTRIEEAPQATGSDRTAGGGSGAQGGTDGSAKRMSVRFDPGDLSADEIAQLRGSNVRLKIPVAATDGEVLAVPIAALSAGSGGSDRVELITGEIDGTDTQTETVTVTAGLAAEGYVEISSEDKRITPGAKIVVGR